MTKKQKRGTGAAVRRTKTSLSLNPDLMKSFYERCGELDIYQSDAMEQALADWLENVKRPQVYIEGEMMRIPKNLHEAVAVFAAFLVSQGAKGFKEMVSDLERSSAIREEVEDSHRKHASD